MGLSRRPKRDPCVYRKHPCSLHGERKRKDLCRYRDHKCASEMAGAGGSKGGWSTLHRTKKCFITLGRCPLPASAARLAVLRDDFHFSPVATGTQQSLRLIPREITGRRPHGKKPDGP